MPLTSFGGGLGLVEQPFHLTDDLRGDRLDGRAIAYEGFYVANDRDPSLSSTKEFLKAQAYPDWAPAVLTDAVTSERPLPDAEGGQVRFPAASARSMQTPQALSVGTWTLTAAASTANATTDPLYWQFMSTYRGDGYALRLDGAGTTLEAVLGRITAGSFSAFTGTATSVASATATHQYAISRSPAGQLTLRVDGVQTGQVTDGQHSRPQAMTVLSTGRGVRDWVVSSIDAR